MLSVEQIKALPLLPSPVTVRVKFTKTGTLKFISHLDLQRTFNRCLLRSRLPVWYTKGFNPHAKLVFSLPLSVGCESVCEYVDIKIERKIALSEVKEMLSAQFTDEMQILDVYYPTAKFSDISYAEYECRIKCKKATDDVAEGIASLLTTSPLNMMKRTKSGEKEIDIIPFIKDINCRVEDDTLVMGMILLASSTEGNLNPEYPIKAACDAFSLLECEVEDYYSLLRKNIYTKDMTPFR